LNEEDFSSEDEDLLMMSKIKDLVENTKRELETIEKTS
jgi:hypothetical protein